MLFCQVWIVRRATTSNLTKPQTFPLEKPHSSNSGLRRFLVFWMSLYKDFAGQTNLQSDILMCRSDLQALEYAFMNGILFALSSTVHYL